jgi:hypothetical protein
MDFMTSITIPKRVIMDWNDKLRDGGLDYDELGYPEYSTVAMWTAKFPDGCEVDIKVNTNTREDGDVWTEGVLFDENGCELSCTDVSDELDGTWYLYCGDTQYTVLVLWGD